MKKNAGTTVDEQIWEIKRKTKRSWIQLRRGCEELSGKAVDHTTFMVGASSRSFARKVTADTGLSYKEVLEWLNRNGLGKK